MMKRLLTFLLTLVFLFSLSVVYAADYSSLTDAQLKEQYDAIRNELYLRGLIVENKTVILEQNGVQIYISGSATVEKNWSGLSLNIPLIVVNSSNNNITITMDDVSVNGWTISSFSASISSNDVPAGKKAKANMEFDLEDTDVETISDFEDAEFTITIYNKDDWFGTKIVPKTKPITIYAK